MEKILKHHLDIFYERINEIVIFIKGIELQKSLVKEINNNKLNSVNTFSEYTDNAELLINSTVQYNAVIISLYGCFENFIDNILSIYLEEVFKIIDKYEDLPNEVQVKHKKSIAEFLLNPHKFKKYQIEEKQVIDNLFYCLNNHKMAQLTIPLLLRHNGNLTIEKVRDLLKDIGIKLAMKRIKNEISFLEFYKEYNDFTSIERTKEYVTRRNDEEIFGILDELVLHRNSVSHSWLDDNRLGYSILKEKTIPFMIALCTSIYKVLLCDFYIMMEENGRMNEFDKALNIYNNNILCINSRDSRLRVGSFILYVEGDNKNIAEVRNIQMNKEDIKEAELNSDIGILLDKRIKIDSDFYYIKQSNLDDQQAI